MKVYLDANSGYQKCLDGTSHNPSWFSTFTYVP
jgi:hypothetical protein